MNRKSKILLIILIAGLCISFMMVPAYAEQDLTTQEKAEILNELSLLAGDENGDYNLDGQLKRSEASTFIVRLMGKEKEVLDNKSKYSSTKFQDVTSTQWFAPYVGFCAENNIISGLDDKKFGPDDFISERAFLRLILAVLDYENIVDYTWDTIYEKAYEIGLIDTDIFERRNATGLKYTRGDVVGAMYTSLNLKSNATGISIVQSLINEGAVTMDQAETAGIIEDSTKTAITEITPLDQKRLSIKLNETIYNVSTDDIKIYETYDISKMLTFTIESQEADEIVLSLTGEVADKEYTLELYNATDTHGNISAPLYGAFVGYRSIELKSDFFRISKVEPVSKNTVNLYFTQPVNENIQLASCYVILENGITFVEGSVQSMAVSLMGSVNDGVTIVLKDRVFTDGAEYTLMISGDLSSAFGVKLNEEQGDSIKFIGNALENEELKLLGTTVINSRTLQLSFNKEINPVLAQQIFNYYITDASGNPIAISKASVGGMEESRGKCVTISVSGVFDKTKKYNIMINNINDINRQYYITEKTYTFDGYYPTSTNLTVVNATPLDAGTLIVYFDRPLDPDSAEIASNFMVAGVTHAGYLAVPVKTYYDPDANPYMIKLFLPSGKNLEGTKTYKLRIMTTLKDYLGNTPSSIIEYGFNSTGSTVVKPAMSDAVIISKDTIKVTFSKEIALDLPNILTTNYTLEYNDSGTVIVRVPTSVIYFDATTMILKFDTLDSSREYTLRFKELKDYSGVNTAKATEADTNSSITVRIGGEQ